MANIMAVISTIYDLCINTHKLKEQKWINQIDSHKYDTYLKISCLLNLFLDNFICITYFDCL